jgi:hypothetical protein
MKKKERGRNLFANPPKLTVEYIQATNTPSQRLAWEQFWTMITAEVLARRRERACPRNDGGDASISDTRSSGNHSTGRDMP